MIGKYFDNDLFGWGVCLLAGVGIASALLWRPMVGDIGFKAGLIIVICSLMVGAILMCIGARKVRYEAKNPTRLNQPSLQGGA